MPRLVGSSTDSAIFAICIERKEEDTERRVRGGGREQRHYTKG